MKLFFTDFKTGRFTLVFFLMLSLQPGLMAQQTSDSICVPPIKKAFVKKAIQLKTSKPEAGLGDYLKVEIVNMDVLLKSAKDNNRKIILYFNEIAMHGIYADFISTKDSSVIFQLIRDSVSTKSWNIFYQGQTLEANREVAVSVGFENDGSIDTKVKKFTLVLVRKNLLYLALFGIGLLLILFIVLVKKTGIIRDENMMESKGPYSLSRTQLAFWTFIIVFSFLYIYIVTGELPPITGSTLILLTISMTTTAGAKMIDSSRNPEPALNNEASDGFFRDIISDHNSISIHRFQMVVWTLLLGLFFIRSVVKCLAMPQFDDSMLILMGVSSGTYLGLKIPEKNAIPKSTTDNQQK
jgi:hypothetical protein